MTGRRRFGVEPHEMDPGDYGYWDRGGHWVGITPNDLAANLSAHTVTEHGDSTITVSPSILVGAGATEATWHGFLEKGVWREC